MDSFKKNNIKNHTVSMLRDTARDMLKSAGMDCCIDGCDHFSIGFKCVVCGGDLCNSHLYFRMSNNKPSSICPFCIVDENNDIFETEDNVIYDDEHDDYHFDNEQKKQDSEEDDEVIDASFTEV